MELSVPFYKQTTKLNCGPTALKMVLDYLEKHKDISEIEKATGIEDGKGLSTIKLAIAAAKLGFETEFFSKHLLFNEENMNLDFYKNYGDLNFEESKKLVEEAEKEGVKLEEKTLSLNEIIGKISENCVPIILMDWNVITDKEKYQGHFVPIVGYDEKNIYVHNQGFLNPGEFVKIDKKLFDKARKAEGTDEDILFVFRKDKI